MTATLRPLFFRRYAAVRPLMQEPDADFSDLVRRYGAAVSRRIWQRSREAVRDFTALLAELDAGLLHHLPSVYYATTARRRAALRDEYVLRHRAGLAGRWLGPDALHALTGLEAPGAIVTEGNAEADPYRACLAMAAAAGAAVFESTTVARIERDGATAKVMLANGAAVRADWAVVATGYATPVFERLGWRFRMMNTYVIATRRLTAAERRRVGLGDVMLWDTRRPYHYLRWTPDDRLLFGGGDRPHQPWRRRSSTLRARAGELLDDLTALFPALRGITADYAWEGLFAKTPDGLPYIGAHRQHPRQLFALGYGGNGMTLGFFGAQAVVRLAQGRPGPDDELFGFGRARR